MIAYCINGRLLARLMLAVWAILGGLAPCRAQEKRVPAPPVVLRAAESQDGVFLPSDRTHSRGIRKAQRRIAEGEFTQAIRFLDELLQPEREDSFVVTGDAGEFSGLKETARIIIGTLPESGKQLYEATYGPVAQRELKRGIESGDFEVIRQVAYRYFHTSAGYEAALLLAQHETDVGRHLSAALVYEELLAAPEAASRFEPQLSLLAAEAWLAAENLPQAELLLDRLRRDGHRSAGIGGRRVQLEGVGRLGVDWLMQTAGAPAQSQLTTERQWLTHRGNASRNGQVEGGLPHMRVRWAVRLLAHPDLEEAYDNEAVELRRHEKSLSVAASPLAVGDYLITRSAHNLIAVDYHTGKRVWQTQPQRNELFDQLISASAEVPENQAEVAPIRAFAERIWHDYLYNSISSDGERVYVIRDLAIPQSTRIDFMVVPGMAVGEPKGDPARSNRLCAYELATQGKLVWEIDGAANRDELAGAFFLGAPLSIGQSLYGLVEVKSAIYLVSLDRRSGEFQWKQQLVNLEADILLDTQRRLQGAVPSYDAGMLVCPTGAGVVVGVDLAKRSLAWAYRYETDRKRFNTFRMRRSQELDSDDRWIDSLAVVSGGRVVLSPPESDSLHCLDLVTGKLLWKHARDKHLFVAGVHDGRVLIVGNDHVTAVRLSDGKPAWQRERIDLPTDALPSGRGFFSHGHYYQPLCSAEVWAIDVQAGVVADRALARDGQVLGNLICHRGAVLSQSGRFLDCFDQIEVLRVESEQRLVENPNDFESLRTLGEIAYNEGRLPEAIEYLERALAGAADNLRTKQVLIECLEVALDEDFATYQDRLPLLGELEQSSGRGQINLLRLQAQGLLEIGDRWGAFEACLRLYRATDDPAELLQLGLEHEVRLSRWLRAQVASIWNLASEEERARMTARLERLLDREKRHSDQGRLRRFSDSFQSLELAQPVLLQLATAYLEDDRPLAAQQLLMKLTATKDQDIRAEAVARCSKILHERGWRRQAGPFDQQLQNGLAETVCLDGKTGVECLAEWSTAETLDGLDWPYGEVEIKAQLPSTHDTSRHGRSPLSRIRLERTDGVLGRGNVFLSVRKGEIIVRDSVGHDIFKAPLEEGQRVQMHHPGNYYGASRGNLLVISQGRQLVAFDTLASGKEGSERILWRMKVSNSVNNRYHHRVSVNTRDGRRPGPSQAFRPQQDDDWVGVIGPLTHDSCILQDQRRLLCIDSISGEVLWWRSDVPPGCDLYGDQQFLFAVPRESDQAMVFSTIDGRLVGVSSVPRWREQLGTMGRQVIRWRKLPDRRRELSVVDSLSGGVVWKRDFENRAQVDIAEGRYVGVLEPSGKCTIVDARDGKLLVDHRSEPTLAVNRALLLAGTDSFLLIAQEPSEVSPERRISKPSPWDYEVLNGYLHLFDRSTGQPAWSRPAEVRQEAFILSQPVDLPVVAFAGNIQRRGSRGSGQGVSLLLLEKASGRLLFHDDTLPQSANYCELKVLDESTHEMAVQMIKKTIHLKFTDRHRAPEPPAIVGRGSRGKKGSSGLQGILNKLLDGD